jgi:DNA primase
MIENFDVLSYLRDRNIPHTTQGKNVALGWVGVQCVFCADRTNHLGINLTTRMLHCWKCGPHGSVANYIMEHENCPWGKAQDIIREYQDATFRTLQKDIRERTALLEIPKGVLRSAPAIHHTYLLGRGFDPQFLTRKYGLQFTNELGFPDTFRGDWRYRVIAPVYVNRRLVNLIGMDVVRNDKRVKYINVGNELSVIPMKECLYNIDSVPVGGRAIVVEGITDVWRGGDCFVSTQGIVFSKEQVALLVARKVSHAFVMFDAEPEAQKRAQEMANNLAGLIPNVEVVELEEGDPAEQSNEKIFEIRKILLDTHG